MQCLKERARCLFRIALFAALTAIMAAALGWFFQPVWKFWNNYNTMHGFYEEPENTIETIFLGASITACGFSVTELYESYGICAYNLGTEQQPVLAPYDWLEEAYRRHSDVKDGCVGLFDVAPFAGSVVLQESARRDAFF